MEEEALENDNENAEAKPKTLADLAVDARLYILESLAGKTLGDGTKMASLNSEGKLPTYEGRGISYLAHQGEAQYAMPLEQLLDLNEGRNALKSFFVQEGIEDLEKQEKIFEVLRKLK